MSIFHRSKPDIDAAYFTYGDLLYRVAFAQLANDADAQDAVQDTFVKYMTKAPHFTDENHEKAWLIRVTMNRCRDIARRNKLHSHHPLSEISHVESEEKQGYHEWLRQIHGLPDIYRSILILHCLEGFSLQESADSLGISLSAAKMRLRRGRDILEQIRQEEKHVF